MITIALDCGASFLKGAVFEEDGTLRKTLHRPAPPVAQGKTVEELLMPTQAQALLSVVRAMLTELTAGQRCARLCIANEMHGFLLTNSAGVPQMDYVSWQRSFGTMPIAEETAVSFLTREHGDALRHTGMPLRGSLPSANLRYLSQCGMLDRMHGELFFCTLGDYLLRALSNAAVPTHPTNAAASGLYDLEDGDWSRPLVRAAGSDRVQFPQVGERTVTFDLDGIRYEACPAIGDQQAALLGAGLHHADQLSFNLGTGAQVSVLTDAYHPCTMVQTRPYFNGRWLRTLPHLPSGRALNVYIRFLQDILIRFGVKADESEIWHVFLTAADTSASAHFDVDLSFFENPCSDRLTGLLAGFGEHDLSLGSLASSILYAMVQNFLWAANEVQIPGQSISELLFSGGIARRIGGIRKAIAAGYPSAAVSVAEDETLRGLWQYGRQAF